MKLSADPRRGGASAAAIAVVLALAACSPKAGGRAGLAAKDFGDAWPFTTSSVNVVCVRGLAMFVTTGGKAYALNGQAERHPELYKFGPVRNIAEIQRPDPQGSELIPGEGMSLATVTAAAIDRCAEAGRWLPRQ